MKRIIITPFVKNTQKMGVFMKLFNQNTHFDKINRFKWAFTHAKIHPTPQTLTANNPRLGHDEFFKNYHFFLLLSLKKSTPSLFRIT